MNDRPVHLILDDDMERSRLTVLFRLILAIPHLIWIGLWGFLAFWALVANWFATLAMGISPESLHNFLAAYVRYAIHVSAYLLLAANPYPEFLGLPGYPVDVTIAPRQRQSRASVLFRIVLVLPAFAIAGVLMSGSARSYGAGYATGLAAVAAFFGWFVGIARARMPRGLRDLVAYALSYSAQLDAYLFLLTDSYPDSDPQSALPELPLRPGDPIQLEVAGELRRSRLTVFFRLILAIPLAIWFGLWGVVAALASIGNWLATLILGQSPRKLHDFLGAYLRYGAHFSAYLFLIAEPYPGFLGRQGAYPIDLAIAEPQVQNRWSVFFRLILAIPVLLLDSAYASLLVTIAFLGWFASLALGRMPVGLRNAGALAIRYRAQAGGYLMLLTDAYPYSGPVQQTLAAPPSGLASAVPFEPAA